MDSKSAQVCRLCLETSDDLVNIFDKFQNSTIASILINHFWFEVHKNDGMSEWLCQICWIQTKTFHHFYKRVEFRHGSHRRSNEWVVGTDALQPKDNVKEEILELDLNLVKCEEPELTLEAIDTETHGQTVQTAELGEEENSHDYNDEPGENSRSSDEDYHPLYEKPENHDNKETKAKGNETPPPNTDTEDEDTQIREFFNMKCDICDDVEFDTLKKAREHYRTVHKTHGYLTCCGDKYKNRCRMLDHIRYHMNPDEFRCDLCDKRFPNNSARQIHIRNIHASLESIACKCTLCGKTFAKESLLKQHMKFKHPTITGEKFPCDKCGKNFRLKLLLACHIRNVHEYSLDHVCETCAQQFKTKQLLENHIINQHSTTPQPKVQCDICGAWLKHRLGLQRHLTRMHQDVDVEDLKCPSCDKVATNKAALATHIAGVHAERRYQCTLCEKAFKRAKNLKEHITLHTGEYLYNCPYCEKKFKSSANMYSHRKKAHLAEWTRDSAQREALKKNDTGEAIGQELNT